MRNPHPFWRYFINKGNAKYNNIHLYIQIFLYFFPEGAGENSK